MRLTERQKQIFRHAVEGHITTGEPISSEWVAAQFPEKVSSATVRNELLELEKAGLLRQPHTSAGRVPTEDGYRYFIETFVSPQDVTREVEVVGQQHQLQNEETETPEAKLRRLARDLSHLAGNIVLVGADPRSLYTTGMGHMMQAAEAQDMETIQHISMALDNADELMEQLYELANMPHGEVRVLIGKQNPFDDNCTLIVTKAATSEGDKIMALLGFMRMRYDRNIALMHAMKRFIESEF